MKNILLFIPLFIFAACSHDSSPSVEETMISVKAFYNVNNQASPDFGSKVYIYYGYDYSFFFYNIYQGAGIVSSETELIEPDQEFVIETDQALYIEPLYRDQTVNMLIESKYYPNTFVTHTVPSCENDIILTVYFNPPIPDVGAE